MSTQTVPVSLAEFATAETGREFDAAALRERVSGMDTETFAALSEDEQRHVLWEQTRSIPFRYVRSSSGAARMRQYLAAEVVMRCTVPTVLFEAFPEISEFRQRRGRAYAEHFIQNSRIFVDFSGSHSASSYRIKEGTVAHELMHVFLRRNDIRLPSEAYRRDGRTDRAWYHNGGFPNWDFNGKDVLATTYLHHTDGRSTPVVSQNVLDDMLSKRLSAYDDAGLVAGDDDDHARDGRADPFANDVVTPADDRDAFLMLVGEANIAWYTTAKAFSAGYEEVARNSIFWSNYTATNPDEMLCEFHEFFQSPGFYTGTHSTVVQAVERHPWLLRRYLDCFEPHPDKQVALEAILTE